MVSPVMELVANLRGKAFRFGIFGRRSWTANKGFALVLQWKSAQSGQCDAAAGAAREPAEADGSCKCCVGRQALLRSVADCWSAWKVFLYYDTDFLVSIIVWLSTAVRRSPSVG
jgi:hypothetical protein